MTTGNHSTATPAVVCDRVVIRYGDTVAVDGLSFEAAPGQVTALLGPNGAGKTSTVEALEGYRPVQDGTLRVLGLDPRRDHAALASRIGIMLQQGGVYPTLGPDQVLRLFSRYYDDAEDPDALVGLVGLTAVRRTPWRRLSGGEQQRLALALALVGKPRILFLDEPTAGVDPEGRIAVRDIIAAQRERDISIILTTHELGEAERLADQVVIIDRGRVLAEGSPATLTAGAADGAIRFSTRPGIDTTGLARVVGAGTSIEEERPGAYRLRPPPGATTPAVVSAIAGWLQEQDLALGDLRTGHSLEEAYLAITAGGGGSDPTDGSLPEDVTSGRAGRRGGRRAHRARGR